MPTNKEWLYSLDPHALTEWFESEHDSNDTLGAKKVVSVHTGTANDANVSEHVETANDTLDGARAALDAKLDSRAKLEADIHEYVHVIAGATLMDERADEAVVHGWLDRQAAITEREIFDEMPYIRDKMRGLQEQVDVLTYERDYYIGLCHRAVEAGEKFATLVDMNGEVLS